VRRWLTARNAWTFSVYIFVSMTMIVLSLSAPKSIAFFVTSFCFSCFMTDLSLM
jgi:hypothetical protein